jgi:HD-GYP domain-containing protein (c-di-GMP phosphodiesterase class II)
MPASQPDSVVRRSEVLAGLSYALDLTEGQRPGHAVRSCLIGMRLAEVLALPRDQRSTLFYALLMKDLGCSSNAARFAALFGSHDHDLKTSLRLIDWSHAGETFRFVSNHVAPGQFMLRRVWRIMGVMSRGPEGARDIVRTRCERGAEIATMVGLNGETAEAIRALDEHWDGQGQPYGLKGDTIPFLARILGLAQMVEVFFSTSGVLAAYEMAIARRGTWFDPALVDALLSIRTDTTFWTDLASDHDPAKLGMFEPRDHEMLATDDDLDRYARAFARVIDAKSPWTNRHSVGVADIAVAIAAHLGFTAAEQRMLGRSALLHDLGKLGVSNVILDKPGPLTTEEMQTVQRHTGYTKEILSRVSCFLPLADAAAAHHERLDGSGYHLGLDSPRLPLAARILAVADIYDALRNSRPYREGLPVERALQILERESRTALDPVCVEALRSVVMNVTPDITPADVPAVQHVHSLAEDYVQAA